MSDDKANNLKKKKTDKANNLIKKKKTEFEAQQQ